MTPARNERGESILGAIYDDVDQHLNPSGEDCWHCGGEGYVHECFDGFCECAEEGCDDCTRECPECVIFNCQRAKAVREEVIKRDDIAVAVAWLKSVGRWNDGITEAQVRAEMQQARSALEAALKTEG